jgi:hypothetical protein
VNLGNHFVLKPNIHKNLTNNEYAGRTFELLRRRIMVELLSKVNSGDLAAVLVVVPVVVVLGVLGLVALVIAAVQRYRDRQIAWAVVTDMLERGIPPAEIIAVLKAMNLQSPPELSAGNRLHQWLGKTAKEPVAS